MGNANSGRRPKPTAIKRAEGGRVRNRGEEERRKRRTREPEYEPGVPECPPELLADLMAVKWWQHFAGLLCGAKVLTSAHAAALANLAKAKAAEERCWLAWQADGFEQIKVYEDRSPSGALLRRHEKVNPLAGQWKELALLTDRFITNFGLSPISAPKIEALGAPPARSDFEAFLGGQGGA
jgi:hypothetical protein